MAAAEFTPEWFDDASRCWRENKRPLKTRCAFRYICQYAYKSGKKCGRDSYKGGELCRQHDALNAIGKLIFYPQEEL